MWKYRLKRISRKKLIVWSTFILVFLVSMGSIVRYYASNATAVYGANSNYSDAIYIDESTADSNYIDSLEYTEITSTSSLPGIDSNGNATKTSSKSKIYVEIVYDGEDINDSSVVGKVTVDGTTYSKLVYEKVLDSTTLELIDNPFDAASNPTGRAFNGWVCNQEKSSIDCNNITLTYDSDYYVRYAEGVTGGTLYLNATWTESTNTTNGSTNGLKSAGMVNLPLTETERDVTFNKTRDVNWAWCAQFPDNSQYYTIGSAYYYDVVPSGAWYYDRWSGSYSRSNGNSYCYDYNGCSYYASVAGQYYKTGTTYYSYSNGRFSSANIDLATLVNAGYCPTQNDTNGYTTVSRHVTTYTVTVTDISLKYWNVGDTLEGFYYNASGNYRLIQHGDTEAIVDVETIEEYVLDDDGTRMLDDDGNEMKYTYTRVKDYDKYYYLVTRDTNIITGGTFPAGSNIPFTLTQGTISTRGTNSVGADQRIEYSTISGSIDASGYNFKVGRGVTGGRYLYGNQNPSNYYKSRVIVESGSYTRIFGQGSSAYVLSSIYNASGQLIVGCDIDKAFNNNSNLNVSDYVVSSYSYSFVDYGTRTTPSMYIIAKSGTFGTYNSGDSSYYTSGIYAGTRGYGENESLRILKIEGGSIFNVNGGPCVNDNNVKNKNIIAIYMTGGYANNVVGGAGLNSTAGNRIVSISGGIVGNAVAGGSNSYSGDTGTIGPINGDTLVYIGGNAIIGGSGGSWSPAGSHSTNGNWYGVQNKGSVFGAGLGKANDTSRGIVRNSYVIIDGSASIYGDVYGGGNYGAVNTSGNLTTNAKTVVNILDGTINKSVYGGSNSNGFSTSNGRGTITVNVSGGNIKGSVYGGSNGSYSTNNNFNVYGTVNVNISSKAIINNSAYAGGYGSNTRVIGDTNVNVTGGTTGYCFINPKDTDSGCSGSTTVLTTDGGVYGGSANGRVNGTSSNSTSKSTTYATTVNVSGGTTSSVYGGGEGSSASPYSLGKINVNISGGTIYNVFGGTNVQGTIDQVAGTDTNRNNSSSVYVGVYVSGGTILNVFGGSNGSNAKTNTPYVKVTGGTIMNVFGGGNLAKSDTTQVDILGGTFVNENSKFTEVIDNVETPIKSGGIYGSGNKATVTISNVNITGGTFYSNDTNGNVSLHSDVYGGGYEAGATTTNVNILEPKDGNGKETPYEVYNAFGGSNQSGDVTTSIVNGISGSVACNVYGGGNIATTETSNVYLTGTTFTATVQDGKTAADMTCGNGFGGGASADVTKSNITLDGSTLLNVYGGSNMYGFVTESNVSLKSGTATNAFGGNNAGGGTITTNVTLDGATLTNIYGGSNGNGAIIGHYLGSNGVATNISYSHKNGDKIDKTGSTLVNVISGSVSNNVFGGGNAAVVFGDTRVNVMNGTINKVFGGGNMAFVGSPDTSYSNTDSTMNTGNYTGITDAIDGVTTTVNIVGGTIGSVFGSGNASFVHGRTYVNLGDEALSSAQENYSSATMGNIVISGDVFGGSFSDADETTAWSSTNVGVAGATHVNVTATNYGTDRIKIAGSIYGEGNNSVVNSGNISSSDDGTSDILILDYGTEDSPAEFASLSRATKARVVNSAISLSGARDKSLTSDTSQYSFVRIDKLYILGKTVNGNIGGSVIYAGGGTYLKNMYSGVANSSNEYNGTLETVNDNFEAQGADNKLYLRSEKMLAVSTGIPYQTKPGVVHGMAYLGIYNSSTYEKGIYDATYDKSQIITKDVYNLVSPDMNCTTVYGSQFTDDGSTKIDTHVDGFYSHFAEAESEGSDNYALWTDYVGVTSVYEDQAYEWVLGTKSTTLVVELKASKYSTQASVNQEINLESLFGNQGWTNSGGVTITVGNVDTGSFGGNAIENSTVTYPTSLIEKTNVPKVATENVDGTEITKANAEFGLSMGTTTSGWKNNYLTDLYSGSTSGDTKYTYDSSSNSRRLSFWLYHSKNVDLSYAEDPDQDIYLGTVKVSTTIYNPALSADQVNNRIVTIEIKIYLTDGEDDGYGYAISPGRKYGTFASESTRISTTGSFSVYQSLTLEMGKVISGNKDEETWDYDKIYPSTAYRYLESGYQLPKGTVISMLDLITNEQYYYVVTGDETKVSSNIDSGYEYRLDKFIKMSNISGEMIYYDDTMGRNDDGTTKSKYYLSSGNKDYAVEEFIFIVDLANADVEGNSGWSSYLQMAIRNKADGVDKDIVSPIGNTSEKTYDAVSSESGKIDVTGSFTGCEIDDDGVAQLYKDTKAVLTLDTSITKANGVTDTRFDDYQLGTKLTLYTTDSDGNLQPLSYDSLDGLVVYVDGVAYYPENSETAGVIRINLAGKVTSMSSDIEFDFSNSSLAVGKYVVGAEVFGSYDGLYYGDDITPTVVNFDIQLLNNEFGILASTEPESVTHDTATGEDINGSLDITYTVKSVNGLAKPKMMMSVEDINGNNKDLCDLVTSAEFNGVVVDCSKAIDYNGDVYYDVGDIANDLTEYTSNITLKNGPSDSDKTNPASALWKSGTYRVVFSVFDYGSGTAQLIGSDYEYLIIRSLDVDEYVVEGSGN